MWYLITIFLASIVLMVLQAIECFVSPKEEAFYDLKFAVVFFVISGFLVLIFKILGSM